MVNIRDLLGLDNMIIKITFGFALARFRFASLQLMPELHR